MPSLPSTPSVFQSTLSMRRATPQISDTVITACISIHALHEESDRVLTDIDQKLLYISIHALHEESDVWWRRYA